MASTDAVNRKRKIVEGAIDTSGEMRGSQGKGRRVGDLDSAFVAEMAVAMDRAQWSNPDLKAGGMDAVAPPWIAEGCNRVLGQGLSEEQVARGFGERGRGEGAQGLEEIQGFSDINGAHSIQS